MGSGGEVASGITTRDVELAGADDQDGFTLVTSAQTIDSGRRL